MLPVSFSKRFPVSYGFSAVEGAVSKLIISRDGEVTQTVQLSKERMTVGRHRHNDIVLDHKTVSGEHALIVTILDDSFLEDLNSTNGSFVNGHRVGKHFLRDKDKITLAKFKIEFVVDGVRPLSGNIAVASAAGLLATVPAPLLGEIEVLNGTNAGKRLPLTKAATTLGRAGLLVVVVSKVGDGYAIAQTEGERAALLNGAVIGAEAQPLANGDVIELSGTRMAFTLK
jgi:pSer/pThr/pTyr-binding forkhead associated (FHA) protein